MDHDHKPEPAGFFRSPFGLILIGLLAIAAFFLIAEHKAHIFAGNWGPALLLLAFVGLHFFMHAGHGGHGGQGGHGGCGGGHSSDDRKRSKTERPSNER